MTEKRKVVTIHCIVDKPERDDYPGSGLIVRRQKNMNPLVDANQFIYEGLDLQLDDEVEVTVKVVSRLVRTRVNT